MVEIYNEIEEEVVLGILQQRYADPGVASAQMFQQLLAHCGYTVYNGIRVEEPSATIHGFQHYSIFL